MKKRVALLISVMCLLTLFPATKNVGAAAVPRGVDSKEWKDLVANAQKEGTISVYNTSLPTATRATIQQEFKKKVRHQRSVYDRPRRTDRAKI